MHQSPSAQCGAMSAFGPKRLYCDAYLPSLGPIAYLGLRHTLNSTVLLGTRSSATFCFRISSTQVGLSMFNFKARFLAGTIFSALALGSVHGAPRDTVFVFAQAPGQSEQDKDKDKKPPPRRGPPQEQPQQAPQQRPQGPPPGQQQRQVQPPAQERQLHREVQPPPQERRGQPQPPAPQERQVKPPTPERQVQPPQPHQPPSRPPASEQRQGQPQQSPGASTTPPQQVPPTPSQGVQPPAPQQRQVQPPPTQQQVQPPPSASTPQPSGTPPGVPQQQTQPRGAAGPAAQPPKPAAPQQPVGTPAIAPSALQPPPAPSGSPAAQAQRAFVPPPAQDSARRLDDVRGARREVRAGDAVMIEEPGRVIIREGGRTIIRHNEIDRFRWQARDAHVERRGSETVTVFVRPDGSRVSTVTDESGRLLRRYRRAPDGREVIIIDNRYSGPPRIGGYFVDLPPPTIGIPRERYIVDTQSAQPDDIYAALWAAPEQRIQRPYTVDELRYSPHLRERMPRNEVG